jgi:hypothetical protein
MHRLLNAYRVNVECIVYWMPIVLMPNASCHLNNEKLQNVMWINIPHKWHIHWKQIWESSLVTSQHWQNNLSCIWRISRRVLNVIKMTQQNREVMYTLQTNIHSSLFLKILKSQMIWMFKVGYFSIDGTSAPIKKQGWYRERPPSRVRLRDPTERRGSTSWGPTPQTINNQWWLYSGDQARHTHKQAERTVRSDSPCRATENRTATRLIRTAPRDQRSGAAWSGDAEWRDERTTTEFKRRQRRN